MFSETIYPPLWWVFIHSNKKLTKNQKPHTELSGPRMDSGWHIETAEPQVSLAVSSPSSSHISAHAAFQYLQAEWSCTRQWYPLGLVFVVVFVHFFMKPFSLLSGYFLPRAGAMQKAAGYHDRNKAIVHPCCSFHSCRMAVQAPRMSQAPSVMILGPPHSTQWCSSKRCGQQQEVKLSVWASSSYQGIKFKNMGNDI